MIAQESIRPPLECVSYASMCNVRACVGFWQLPLRRGQLPFYWGKKCVRPVFRFVFFAWWGSLLVLVEIGRPFGLFYRWRLGRAAETSTLVAANRSRAEKGS